MNAHWLADLIEGTAYEDVLGREAYRQFLVWVDQQQQQLGALNVLLIAHNGRDFDLPWMRSKFSAAGQSIPTSWWWFDTYRWANLCELTPAKLVSAMPWLLRLQHLHCKAHGHIMAHVRSIANVYHVSKAEQDIPLLRWHQEPAGCYCTHSADAQCL